MLKSDLRSVVQQEENQLGLMRRDLPRVRELIDTANGLWIRAHIELVRGTEPSDDVAQFVDDLSTAIGRLERSIEKVEAGE